jgi:ribosomal protein S18 acetylase RimI-like enzyme
VRTTNDLPASLDNAVWHALAGPQARFSQRVGNAVRYEPDVGVFAAIPDSPKSEDWEALRTLVGPGEVAFLFRVAATPLPQGWTIAAAMASLQMVAPATLSNVPLASVEPVRDEDELAELIMATRPGPWLPRTRALGPFFGIYEDDQLVAAAGVRLVTPDATEISAVATAESARGRGLASALVAHVADRIRGEGRTPFLHLLADNVAAFRCYDRLGFVMRPSFDGVAVVAPA